MHACSRIAARIVRTPPMTLATNNNIQLLDRVIGSLQHIRKFSPLFFFFFMLSKIIPLPKKRRFCSGCTSANASSPGIKDQNLNFYLETHSTSSNIYDIHGAYCVMLWYYIRLQNQARNSVYYYSTLACRLRLKEVRYRPPSIRMLKANLARF